MRSAATAAAVRIGGAVPRPPAPARPDGFVLPIVLLLMVAASGLATIALLVARSEVVLAEGDFRYLTERLRWEGAVGVVYGGTGSEGGDEWVQRRRLPHGFVLLRSGNGAAPAYHAVAWLLEPDSVAPALPPAAEVGWGIPDEGVEWGEPACGAPGTGPLVRARPSGSDTEVDPPLDPHPRLGPVGLERLGSRARPLVPGVDALPWPAAAVVWAPPGSRLEGGEGRGLLLASGDLTVGGEARWHGVVLVEGDLDLDGAALLRGAALVGGRLRIRDQARLVGCRAAVVEALGAPGLERPFPVHAARSLGRF